MIEFLEDDNPENIKPPVVTKFFYDAANLVVGSIDSYRLPEELANTTPRSYGITSRLMDEGSQEFYYLNFRRGVGHNVWGECDIELNIVEISDDNNRVALNILPDGKAKAKKLYTGPDGHLKSGPSSLGAGKAEEFLARFYDEDGAFRLRAVASIPEDLSSHLYNARRVLTRMTTIETPEDREEKALLSGRIGFFVKRLFTARLGKEAIPVPIENPAIPDFDDQWLKGRLEVFSGSKELLSAITKAFTAYKNDNTSDENGDTIEQGGNSEGTLIKAGDKYWSLKFYMDISEELGCILEEIPVGGEESSVVYKFNSSTGSLHCTEIVPGQDHYISEFKEPMAIATGLAFITRPSPDNRAPEYRINNNVVVVSGAKRQSIFAKNCEYRQATYSEPCSCPVSH